MRLAAVLLAALMLSGCVGAIPVALDAIAGGVGIYQRYEDRQAQKDQTQAIREQTEEVVKLREAIESRWPVLLAPTP